MDDEPPSGASRSPNGPGTVLALVSALAFASAGPLAKPLLASGWTAGSVALTRLGGAALVLAVPFVLMVRARSGMSAPVLRAVVIYGVVAMAGVQVAFFSAVRTLDVGVALLIEFLAPVLLLTWTSVRTWTLPARTTLSGAALTMVGLALVVEPTSADGVDLVGVGWALAGAGCLSAYFALAAREGEAGVPPMMLACGGTVVGAVVVGLAGVTGLLPMRFTTSDAVFADGVVAWPIVAVALALVSAVVAYSTGIAAISRLGVRSASFLALTEVLFAVLLAWALLGEVPGLVQLVGGCCIVAGIVLVRHQQMVPTAAGVSRLRWGRGRVERDRPPPL